MVPPLPATGREKEWSGRASCSKFCRRNRISPERESEKGRFGGRAVLSLEKGDTGNPGVSEQQYRMGLGVAGEQARRQRHPIRGHGMQGCNHWGGYGGGLARSVF